MNIKRFDDRLERIHRQPGAVPTRDLVDRILDEGRDIQPRGVELTLAGSILGILTGVGLKGMYLPDSPWGPGTGLAGAAGGTLALAGLAISLLLAVFAALKYRSLPSLMSFASMNLLMIVVLLLS